MQRLPPDQITCLGWGWANSVRLGRTRASSCPTAANRQQAAKAMGPYQRGEGAAASKDQDLQGQRARQRRASHSRARAATARARLAFQLPSLLALHISVDEALTGAARALDWHRRLHAELRCSARQ
eukprot:6212940-Pleurochrysis_carterae.AAC.1